LKSYEFLFDMLPFMFVAPPLLVLPRLVLPMLLLPMLVLPMLLLPALVLPALVLVVPVPEFVLTVTELALIVTFAFDTFAFVLVLSAGEQAVQTPATVSKARRAKVLRIEFPPEPF
jgi:hypothetical protein